MSNYKEQLSKHEELINKYKDLYLNENSKSLNESSNNKINYSNSNSIPININNTTNNIMMNNSFNKFNNTDIEKSIEFHSENNRIGMSDFSSNKKNNNSNIINNKDINVEQSLERINNLLSQLNSKNETPNKKNIEKNSFNVNNMKIKIDNSDLDNNSINKIRNSENENNELSLDNVNINQINNNNKANINKKFLNDFNNNNNYNFKYGQLTIDNILAKYRNNTNNQRNLFNTFNKFNINQNNNNNAFDDINSSYMLTFQNKQNDINPFIPQENIINNLDKMVQNKNISNIPTINNTFIQKIKAKYLFNNDSLTNKISKKNQEISELEQKLNFYKNKLFSQNSPEDNYINLKLDIKNLNLNSSQENSYTLNSKNNTKSINLNTSEIYTNNNNNSSIPNDKSFSFKNNLKNNQININSNNNPLKESKFSQSQLSHNNGEETINFSLSEDESGLSGYFKFKGSQIEEKDKEYNYNDVLPIINKVSKLKEIKEEDDINNTDKLLANKIINNVIDNVTKNEDEKYKNIMDKFKEEEKENDLLYNQINNQSLNFNNNGINEKPKLIRKNSSDKDKKRNINNKIISFEEFLSKENSND